MIKRLLSRTAGTALLLAVCGWTTVCAAADFDAIVTRSAATGGLCVQLGGGDGTGTLRLAGEGRTLVHRLEGDGERVAQVRRLIASTGLYGQVSAEHWSSTQLPYIDNLVNVIVVDDSLGVSEEELLRVLCPKGVAYVRNGNEYREIHKPRPPEMGEWTHPWHGANGNMVSEDTYLDVPNGVQWIAGPLFPMDARKSSAQGLVTANGRLFNITQNELPNLSDVAQGPPNFLVARDAFNGLRLWSRPWTGPVIGGTANVSIIAHGDRVYGLDADQLVVLDAATGKLLKSLPAPVDPYKILYTDGRLTVEAPDGLSAVDTNLGMIAWRFPASRPYGTVVDGGRVFCIVGTREKSGRWLHEVLCLDLQTGEEQWRKPVESQHALQKSSALRIQFAANGILCLIDRQIVRVYAAQDGRVLWTKTSPAEGRGGWDTRLVGHFFGQGLLWMRQNDAERKLDSQEVWHGLDPMTGEVQRELKTSGNWPQTGAPAKMGCQPLMATERFIMFPRQATCVDFTSGEKRSFKFARGGCVVGAVPANGLAYVTPHACGCFSETLRGFISVRSGVPQVAAKDDVSFEKGPAFDAEIDAFSGPADAQWPIYRHDPLRSGSTPNKVAPRLKLRWSAQIDQSIDTLSNQEWKLRVGNRVTSSVIAYGTAYVAVPNGHRLVALNAETGSELWQFTAGGRIDTPPTIHEGLCLFGAHDGWVYCLRAIDGNLIWRRRAAPTDKRMIAFGQVESIAPLAGTVLIHDGQAYIAAGRAPDADSGIRVMALEPRTGRVVWDETISDAYFGLCDYLVSNGKQVYLSNWQFDPKTGKNRPAERSAKWLQGGKVGLLEASWTHIEMALRKHIQEWTYADTAGQLLAFSSGQIFGFKWTEDGSSRTLPAVLFATGKQDWNLNLRDPRQIESLILTRDVLFVAGPKDRRNPNEGGILSSVAPGNGQIISETALATPPVFDGLAAADGHLYVTTQDGKLLCYEGADKAD
jgi:outer membrane protein assembly factor BamB